MKHDVGTDTVFGPITHVDMAEEYPYRVESKFGVIREFDEEEIEYILYKKEDTLCFVDENLELTNEMIVRIDEIDNTIQQCLCVLAEKDVDWDMEIIGRVAEYCQSVLAEHGIEMRWPGVVTREDGFQAYSN